jgi:polyisoprenoid-binding protein YceI
MQSRLHAGGIDVLCRGHTEAHSLQVLLPESQVGFAARQAVEGIFQDFEAEINFDPDDLSGSRVLVTIDTASVDTRSKDRDAVIRSSPFFNVASHPTAHFEADRFEPQADGGYIAHGRLTLRGVTQAVALPFRLEIARDAAEPDLLRAEAAGDVAVSRMAASARANGRAPKSWPTRS